MKFISISSKFIKIIFISNLILIFELTCTNTNRLTSQVNFEKRNDILNQIVSNRLSLKNTQVPTLALFIEKLGITLDKENTCSSKTILSNVQAQIRSLNSIISTCPGYCRIAMNTNGVINGARDFILESKQYLLLVLFQNFKVKLQ